MKRFLFTTFLLFLTLAIENKSNAVETIPQPPVKLIIKQNDDIIDNTFNKYQTEEELQDEAITKDENVLDNSDVEFAELEELETVKIEPQIKSLPEDAIESSIEPSMENLKVAEETLFQKIYKMQIERTDIPSYMMKDELTFDFERGPLNKLQVYGAYHSTLTPSWTGNDYDTNYTNEYIQFGIITQTAEKNTSFQGLFNLMPHKGRTFIKDFIADAYFINTAIPNNKILLGVSRNQIGIEGGLGAFTLPFAMRSQISRTFGSTRALGVRLVGDYSLVNYSFAMNSSDRYFRDFFPGVEFTGWVNFKPLGKTDGRYGHLVIGGGLNAGKNVYDYTVAGAYVGYKYKRLFANAEYAIADGYNGHAVSTDKASGFYTTVGYKVTPKLQILARADYFDPNRDLKNNSRDEYTIGVNYFIKGQALKLILNYVFCHNHNMPDSNRFIVGTQILI